MKKVTIHTLINWKKEGKVFASITAYDASFAQLFEEQNMPVLLVGDSLGNVLQGKASTLDVSMEEMIYHTRCVRAGNTQSLLLADMPFMSYETIEKACLNAGKLMKAGANMVKLEGEGWLVDTVKRLTQLGVPVCAHMGLMPQSVNVLGGFKVQGREEDRADQITRDALALQNAGAQLLVIECVPQSLAERLTNALHIPVIGIGAGNVTDGQILVMHDVLGISTGYIPSFSKNFLADHGNIRQAITAYIQEVENRQFPSSEHTIA